MEPANILTVERWNDNLFCPFCGQLVWNAESPGDFEQCPHYLFIYGLGEILDYSKLFAQFISGNEDLGIEEIVYECSYSFPNFVALYLNDPTDPAIIGLAAKSGTEQKG